jgi:flagellar assembly protein FliH
MICKVADADVVTEDLTWQPLGTGEPTSVPRGLDRPAPTPLRVGGERAAGSVPETEVAALQRRIADVEAKSSVEVERARRSGFEEGRRHGKQESETEMQAALDRLARTIQDVAQVKRKVRAEAENELVKLSLAIARRILHRELTADPQALRGVVYAALQRLQNREITRIRVFPTAVPAVRAALERNGGAAALEIVPDGLLQPGGLLFETSLGDLDASVETQLQEIERGFADRLQLR